MSNFRIKTLICLSFLSLTIFGCLPEKRIAWSPDGKRAAVATPTGLYLIDAKGELLPPRLTGTPTRCVWTADGEGLLVAHARKVAKWDELTTSMSADEKRLIELKAVELRERVLSFEAEWEEFYIVFG